MAIGGAGLRGANPEGALASGLTIRPAGCDAHTAGVAVAEERSGVRLHRLDAVPLPPASGRSAAQVASRGHAEDGRE
ncbi:hypothetical protein CFP65_7348 [Kitasatospora sp. MMS16-BH015]|nr:hypothetical protein CFP65_7348 [Kitasatospora sp. MMS16-BH015]